MLAWLSRDELAFPALESALREPNGLLAAGGDLSVERLLAAYRHGCFPWYQDGQPLLWWSPDPRMVLFPGELHVSRSLRKRIRQQPFQVTLDQAFQAVIGHCAGPRRNTDGTWITSPMQRAYLRLHELGVAHSVEVWQEQQLVGGLYGLAMGRLFFGESMFSHATDASKIGFAHLVECLREWGFELLDCQMHTRHLASFGAREIPRTEFAAILHGALGRPGESNWRGRASIP
ncbi:leucyl/phenylalanyl-tRNA--protein transferase [Stutzerimonas kirkiae]|uniref:Leucyl/phenylalanyl-tRNA--protein transferase n=1 Tax=Stutzerimonas kirkiae TaxID=2211392 RepID=A0A4Q9R812_9GAMM|nr:leucyl/phenylalanyl-tRNA--protein transferase [Stutzerimonas kirkiae]TBU96057.1 leucyl/phenylalanyl-tRNA--protein transferase [Stutzerimonas kirkiae]TBV03111.1 leucyl/phenylalanyl-tRNA--protein transferase [Stutzerimonas kirkiae]TBV09805.1 leucyl/phenylalanyl-tRNA--protein transferase [Stutzerimonas kirkiae]TBV13465.1 leucyl/phenylalanyl-tRNA--protein transferase [Stutzerimonas kirkiae]